MLALTRRITDNFAAHGLVTHGTGTGTLSSVPRAQLARVAPLLAGYLLRQQNRVPAVAPPAPAPAL